MTLSRLMHPTTMAGVALAISLALLAAVILGLA
jgi:hypothetical protein